MEEADKPVLRNWRGEAVTDAGEADENKTIGFRAHGKPEDSRDDLPQIVIGMAVTREGIPVRGSPVSRSGEQDGVFMAIVSGGVDRPAAIVCRGMAAPEWGPGSPLAGLPEYLPEPNAVGVLLLFEPEFQLCERVFQPRYPAVLDRSEPVPGRIDLRVDDQRRVRNGGYRAAAATALAAAVRAAASAGPSNVAGPGTAHVTSAGYLVPAASA